MHVPESISLVSKSCFHCGDECNSEAITIGDMSFCCNGCKSVYELLNENDLCNYYNLNKHPGLEQNNSVRSDKFEFLDNTEIKSKLLQYSNGTKAQLTFYIPQIHCSSCLWLLENIHNLDQGIIESRVNFSLKEVFISYNEKETSLRKVVELLTKVGYEPHLSLSEVEDKTILKVDRKRWYKIGVAGFCFANIMMISLADYFAISNSIEPSIKSFFSYTSIVLSLPVLFYSASEFFVSAWKGLLNKYLNIDLPVALALVITFARSIYEITQGIGTGYLDSMAGIVFFMLIGRWLQARTYKSLSFDRDYKSFFPISLNMVKEGHISTVEIAHIKRNDVVQIHAGEIIPIDAILSKGDALIDYSFVSGESEPVQIQKGEIIYAGGKQLGGLIELIVVKEVSQSYLTNLWNNPIFNKEQRKSETIYDTIASYFTYAVLGIGAIAALFWFIMGQEKLMWNSLTTVLIVACPCALLLSQNYTNGHIIRILARNKFYLKSADIINQISEITHIVFDKTGTLTQANASRVSYVGKVFTADEKVAIASLLKQSAHPASSLIYSYLNCKEIATIANFKETEGQGIEAWVNESHIKIGSINYIGGEYQKNISGSKVVISIDGKISGDFSVSNQYRFGISKVLKTLKEKFTLSLLSGDNDYEQNNIEELLGKDSDVLFHQNPKQKLEYIRSLQNSYHMKVMMIGDGLNDAGALKQSDIGIAVADAKNSFTPSSDAIIDAKKLNDLDKFIQLASDSKTIIFCTFALSAIYNLVGLFFAVQGILSPVIAAILMPLSSISIIILTYGLTEYFARKSKLSTI